MIPQLPRVHPVLPDEERAQADISGTNQIAVEGELALLALAHTILVIVYQIPTKREPYREMAGTYFDERERQRVEQRLVHRLERLSYQVTLQTTAPPLTAIS